MAQIKCDFFEVVPHERSRKTFEQILDEADRLPDDDTRTIEYGSGDLVRLQGLITNTRSGLVHGQMMRLRMQHGPLRANRAGATHEFDLEDDEGFGEHTQFAYHEATRTIVVHKTNTGVPPGAIRYYFASTLAHTPPIEFRERVNGATFEKFRGMHHIKKIEVAVAAVRNPQLLTGQIGGVFRSFFAGRPISAPRVSVTLSMGHLKEGSLGDDAVKDDARELLTMNADNPGQLQGLAVTGTIGGEEKSTVLDLLEDKNG